MCNGTDNKQNLPFISLHSHSSFSFLDGYGTPTQMASRLEELGQTACGLTDHGNVFSHLEANHEWRKRGIKPIFGCEYYHCADMRKKGNRNADGTIEKKDTADDKRKSAGQISHITILAKNEVGYGNLLKLSRMSYEEGFYRWPRIDWNEIIKHQEGLYVLSGCVAGMLSRQINRGQEEVAHKWLIYLKERIENFFVEIVPCPTLDISLNACAKLWQMAEELNIPRVITSDSHFPRPEDYPAQDAMLAVGMHEFMDGERKIRLPDYHYLCSSEEIFQRAVASLPAALHYTEIEDAISRTAKLAEAVDFELPKSKGPVYPVDIEIKEYQGSFGEKALVTRKLTQRELLLQWIAEGKKQRENLGLIPPIRNSESSENEDRLIYEAREKREMEIIDFHGFYNYFLIVSDIVRWSNSQKHLCIARGSAAGSLLCWYLGITQVDPIKFDLPVERFIDETRPDLPDIDLDFDSRYRDSAFHYLLEKYGRDNCGQIAALSYYRGKAAVRDIGRVFKIPNLVTEKLCAQIPNILDADEGMKSDTVLQRVYETNDEIKEILKKWPQFKLAERIEGQIRQSTIHAAGFIIDAEPLANTVGIIAKPDTLPIVACDKDYAAKQGLLKIDALSVSTLSVIAECLEKLGKDFAWLYSLPLDDEETYRLVSTGKSTGVFQLQGNACSRMLKNIKPVNIIEFVSVSALARPGPLQSGSAEEYVNIKHGKARMPKYHPAVMKVVGKTNGIILYQEQVMAVARELGNIDWKSVHGIRKTITSRGGANKIDVHYPAYIKYATETLGIPEKEAEHIWTQTKKAGNYVFNKAHVTMYGIIGYWTAYLKAHYPSVFTAIACKYEDDSGRRAKLLSDFQDTGGNFRLIDPNKSGIDFTAVNSKTLVGGFRNLDGIGAVFAKKLVAGQPYATWQTFYTACPKRVRENLIACGLHTGKVDPERALVVAPWYIKAEFNELELAFFDRMNCTPITDLAQLHEDGAIIRNVNIGGKVTAIKFTDMRKEAKKYGRPAPAEGQPYIRCSMVVTDRTGSVEVMFNAWKWDKMVKERCILNSVRGDGLGNGIFLRTVIPDSGPDRLWAEDAIIVRHIERDEIGK